MSALGDVKLPAGWAWARLGELGEYVNGRGFRKSEWSETGRPIIRIQNLTGSGSTFNHYAGMLEERHTVHPGDLLVSWAATLGVYIWRGPEAALNQHIFKVEPFINRSFLRHLIEYKIEELVAVSHGSGMVHVTRSKFEDLVVAIPPLAEQQRIVEALEGHLSRLDVGMGLLDQVERKTRALRAHHQALMSSPISEENAGEYVPFGDLIVSSRGGWSRSRLHLVPPGQGTPYLKMNNITMSGELSLDNIVHVAATPDDLEKYGLRCGDILFNNKNSAELAGKTALVDERASGWVFNENISRIRVCDSVLPEFAVLQMNSPKFRSEIRGMSSASTNVAAIYARDLKRAQFFLPSLEVQKDLIAKHADLSYGLAMVKPSLGVARNRAISLKLALLRHAFSGNLVPQNPADESASVSLGRILAQRAAQAGKGKVMDESARRRPRKTKAMTDASPSPCVTSSPADHMVVQQEFPL